MKKQHIFISFTTPYHVPQLVQPFRNDVENTNSAVRFEKFYVFSNYSLTIESQKKLSTCGSSGFAAAFQLHIIRLIPINGLEMRSKIRFTFLCKEKTVFKTALKPLTFCQKFNLGQDTRVHSFPTVYSKPHLGKVGGSSAQHRGKFRSNNSGSKIVEKRNFMTTREQNPPTSEISI